MPHCDRRANAFPKRRMRVDSLTDIDGIRTHLNRQRYLTNHLARAVAKHFTTADFIVAQAIMVAV